MSGLKTNPTDWAEADVLALLHHCLPETLLLEFKSDVDLTSRKQRLEAAKDISGMANSAGGWIVYGVAEHDGAAAQLTPVSDPLFVERLDNVLIAAVVPRPTYRIAQVPTTQGLVVVVRVEPSSLDVHQVCAYGDNRFYKRSERGVHPMTEPEIREAYARVHRLRLSVADRLDAVLDEHLAALAKEQIAAPFVSAIAVPLGAPDDWVNPGSVGDFRDIFGESDVVPAALRPAEEGLLVPKVVGGDPRPVGLHVARDGVVHVWLQHCSPETILYCISRASAVADRVWIPHGWYGPAKAIVSVASNRPIHWLHPRDPPDAELPELPARLLTRILDYGPDGPAAWRTLLKPFFDWLWQCMGKMDCPWVEADGSMCGEWERSMQDPRCL